MNGLMTVSFSGTPPMVDLLVPPPEDTGPGKLTVGKVYGGMLILENWKLSRFGQGFNTNKGLPVSSSFHTKFDKVIPFFFDLLPLNLSS